jgi:hypothetical protein
MLRPTHIELLSGLQRTIAEALLPELTSPYAQAQAMSAVGMLAFVAASLDAHAAYDAAEIKDLRTTCMALARLGARSLPKNAALRAAQKNGARAAKKPPPDRRAMEAAIAEFAAALALKQIDGAAARHIRGYLRRHLERMRALLGVMQPGG